MKAAFRLFLIAFVSLFLQVESFAQCAMCNATAESSLDSGSTAAKGLNTGVLYLFLMPLMFLAFIGYQVWKRRSEF